ncbi:MAG: DUF308 domain-containing protein [Gemmataceae bacterium]
MMSSDLTPSALPPRRRLAPTITEDLQELKAAWYWFVLLGLGLIALGLAAIVYAPWVTKAFMWVFGILLIFAGVLAVGGAFFIGGWGGFFITLLLGVLQLVAGTLCIRHPGDAAIVYTLMLTAFLLVGGLFRVAAALTSRFRAWGWVLGHGVVSVLLGVVILLQMPEAGLVILGMFIGIEMIFSGAIYLVLGLQVRTLPV